MNWVSVSHSSFWSRDLDTLPQRFLAVCHIIMCLWLVILGQLFFYFFIFLFITASEKLWATRWNVYPQAHQLLTPSPKFLFLLSCVQMLSCQVVWVRAIENCDGWAMVVYFDRELPLNWEWYSRLLPPSPFIYWGPLYMQPEACVAFLI